MLRALHIEQGSYADRTQSMAQWAEGMGVAVKSNEEIMHTISRFGMKKFAEAVMYVLQTVLDPSQPSLKGQESLDWQKRWPWMICEPNEKEGEFLLNEKHYTEEVLWEPFFRVYHWIWRRFELWRY